MTVIEAVHDFLMRVVTTTAQGGKFHGHWPKGGPWQPLKKPRSTARDGAL